MHALKKHLFSVRELQESLKQWRKMKRQEEKRSEEGVQGRIHLLGMKHSFQKVWTQTKCVCALSYFYSWKWSMLPSKPAPLCTSTLLAWLFRSTMQDHALPSFLENMISTFLNPFKWLFGLFRATWKVPQHSCYLVGIKTDVRSWKITAVENPHWGVQLHGQEKASVETER